MKLKLVTGNAGKVREFERLLRVEIEAVKIPLPEFQSADVAEVAQRKAAEAYKAVGGPVIVDDTGLTIDAWNQLPGAFIAWFLDNVGNEGIIKMLEGWDDRNARVTTAIGYADERGVQVFEGVIQGIIADVPAGQNGFGYDPIFVPDTSTKTFAEMTDSEKDLVSMRRLATIKLRKWLDKDSSHN